MVVLNRDPTPVSGIRLALRLVPFRATGISSTTCSSGWSPRQESNLYLALRRHSFYPLNYEEEGEL